MEHQFNLVALATTALQATGATDDGLTIGEVIAHVPHDLSAFVIYALLFGAVAFVWISGRPTA